MVLGSRSKRHSQVSVCPWGGVGAMCGRWGRRACIVGACVVGGHAWQGGVHGRACVAGGMHGKGVCMAGGNVWWGVCVAEGVCMAGQCVAGETATAAGGTHPTGMHSCNFYLSFLSAYKIGYVSLFDDLMLKEENCAVREPLEFFTVGNLARSARA